MSRRTTGPVALVLLGICACSSDDLPHVTRADSAGVSVVTNDPGQLPERLMLEPDLTIGAEEGEPHLLFGDIADLAVDGSGRLLVLDQQASQVRVFDRDGNFVRALGRRGSGPGELSTGANAVFADNAGNVYIADPMQGRIAMFDSAGAVLPPISIPSRPSGQSWARLADGGYLLRGQTVARDSTGSFAFSDAMLRIPTPVADSMVAMDTLFIMNIPRTPIGAPPDLRIPLIVNVPFWTRLADGRIAWSSLDRADVLIHDSTGELQSIMRSSSWTRRAAAPGDVSVLREKLAERLAGFGGDVAAAHGQNVDAPDSLPAITALLAGPGGELWVQRMGDVGDVHPSAVNSAAARTAWLGGREWDVLDESGAMRRQVALPAGMRPLRITESAVYGVHVDSLGVQRVVRLRLPQ